MKKHLLFVSGAFLILGLTFGMSYLHQASAIVPGINYLVSQGSSGTYANDASSGISVISGDGRYVAFEGSATNLVPSDTNGYQDVFVKDTTTGTVILASIDVSGNQLTNPAYLKDMSYDGRYVLFQNGYNGTLWIRDLIADTTTKPCPALTCGSYGMTGGAISADGRYVTYGNLDYPGHKWQVMLWDNQAQILKTLSVDASGNVGNADSHPGGISCDGGTISFNTSATNLPSGPGGYLANFDLNGNLDLTKLSFSASTRVSCNGNVLLYRSSNASTLYEYSRLTGQTDTIASVSYPSYTIVSPSMSDDGRYVTYTTKAPQTTVPSYPTTGAGPYSDVYLYDTKTGTKQLITFTAAGNKSGMASGGATLSADGSKVTFGYYTPSSSDPTHELISGTTTGTGSTRTDMYTSLTGY